MHGKIITKCFKWKHSSLGLHQIFQGGLFDSSVATETQNLLTPSLVPKGTLSCMETRLWDAVFP